MTQGMIIGLSVGIPIAVLVFFFAISYRKAPPNVAYIISGIRKSRILIGRAGLVVPFFERIDKIPLDIMSVDIVTSSPVPTKEFININLDGVANIKISAMPDQLLKAAQMFLRENKIGIIKIAKEVFEGNMREIVGQMNLTELVHNRDAFADKVKNSAEQDMSRMGIEIISINIQNFSDKDMVIENLGIENVSQISKTASIARANAKRDVDIASAKAREEANKIVMETETKIAEQNTGLRIKEAQLKMTSDTAKADADAAYSIQKEIAQVKVNETQMNAEIAKREKQVVLGIKDAEVRERELDAKIRKEADAQKYAIEQQAKAKQFDQERLAEVEKFKREKQLEVERKQAETENYKRQQIAAAMKVEADARKYSMEAEAEGIKAKGLAEAKAIEMKAEAMKKMDSSAVLDLVLKSNVLPDVVSAMSQPIASGLGRVESITMYGEGNGAKLTEDITKSQVQLSNALKDALGLDLKTLLAGLSGYIGAKVAVAPKREKDETKAETKANEIKITASAKPTVTPIK